MARRWILLLAFSASLSVGCSREFGGSQGNVAVVDLDAIAEQLGLSQQWNTQLSQKQSTVKQKLVGYQQQLNEQFQQKRAEVVTANGADSPLAEDQQLQLAGFQQDLSEKLRQAHTEARKHLDDQRNHIIRSYRQQAEQVCQEVARQKGFDVVLTKNESVVLTFDAAADITPEVATAMRTRLASLQPATKLEQKVKQ